MKIKELKWNENGFKNENEKDYRRCFKWKESISRGVGDSGIV